MSQILTYDVAKILYIIGFYLHNEMLRMHVVWIRPALAGKRSNERNYVDLFISIEFIWF